MESKLNKSQASLYKHELEISVINEIFNRSKEWIVDKILIREKPLNHGSVFSSIRYGVFSEDKIDFIFYLSKLIICNINYLHSSHCIYDEKSFAIAVFTALGKDALGEGINSKDDKKMDREVIQAAHALLERALDRTSGADVSENLRSEAQEVVAMLSDQLYYGVPSNQVEISGKSEISSTHQQIIEQYEQQRKKALALIESVQGEQTWRLIEPKLKEILSEPPLSISKNTVKQPVYDMEYAASLPTFEENVNEYGLYKNRPNKEEFSFDYLGRCWGKYLNYFNSGRGDYLYQDQLRKIDPELVKGLEGYCYSRSIKLHDLIPPKSKRTKIEGVVLQDALKDTDFGEQLSARQIAHRIAATREI